MIYNSLEILPIKLFFKIIETKNVKLLSDDESHSMDELNELWNKLYEEYTKLNKSKENKRVVRLSSDIESLLTRQVTILMICESLRFQRNKELEDILRLYRYPLNEDNYFADLSKIEKECKTLSIKAEEIRKLLPKEDKKENLSIDVIMAGYSLILGFDFDYNTVSVTKFYALQHQVKVKVEASKNIK